MSNTQYVFLTKASVPGREALQGAIDALGVDLELDPAFMPFEDEGFVSCILNDEQAGFEIFHELAEVLAHEDKALKTLAGTHDYCISLSWRGDMKDYACVMAVSYVMAKEFGATVSFEGGSPDNLDKLLSDTRAALDSVGHEKQKATASRKARDGLTNPDDVEAAVKEQLKAIEGCKVTGVAASGMLAIAFANGSRITSNAFSCQARSGGTIDVSGYTRLRSAQIALMETGSDELTPEQEAQWDEIEGRLDSASEEDAGQEARFIEELGAWPDDIYVSRVEWSKDGTLSISFSNVPDVNVQVHALDSSRYVVALYTSVLDFQITKTGCVVPA